LALVQTLRDAFERQGFIYNLFYIALIYFFCYFWTSVIFNPKDMANNLKDHAVSSGYRPESEPRVFGKGHVAHHYVGAGSWRWSPSFQPRFTSMGVDYRVASFYGGTGLLIVVSVALDLVQKSIAPSHANYPG